LVLLVFGGVLLAGCFGKKKPDEPPKPARLDLITLVSPGLNPDPNGRASPLVVRVYALRSLAEFEKADFFSLYEKDEQILASDLVKREEMVLKPGESLKLPREYPPDVTAVAVMAAFRNVERSTWRASLALPPNASGVLTLKADANAVSLGLEAAKKDDKD
jgi:type VI secretion system protein VasD